MATELRVPTVGESISEVVVGQWLKKVGDKVAVDDPVVEIDTDKVSTEILAPTAGFIVELRASTGDTLKVGDVIAMIGDSPVGGSAPAASAPAPKAAAPTPAAAKPAPVAAPVVMPAAAREMATSGVSMGDVTPTGPGGRVLKEDVQRAAPAPKVQAPPAPAPAAPSPSIHVEAVRPAAVASVPTSGAPGRAEHAVKMTPLRKRIAQRLVESQSEAALLTTFNEVDMQPVMDLRKAHQDAFVARHGIKLGFMSFFVKAACDALRLVPAVNASVRGDEIVYHDYCDIGVAVGGGKGLVVPIIRNAERLGFAEVEKTIAEYGKRAKDNKLTLEEMQGGTFTVSNGGIYGSMMSTPIVNPPQSGILGMHAINDRPVAVNGQVVIRPIMYIALTYDHRIIDGREAVTFLKRIKECVENPARMLIEV